MAIQTSVEVYAVSTRPLQQKRDYGPYNKKLVEHKVVLRVG